MNLVMFLVGCICTFFGMAAILEYNVDYLAKILATTMLLILASSWVSFWLKRATGNVKEKITK